MTGARLSTSVEPERLVKTHCCFCGQQCGIQLKVRDNEVIGFEPWEEFPFNRGMLCPKGVKRYLQGSHPDRLAHRAAARSVGGRRLRARCRTTTRSRAPPPRSRGCKPRTAPASIGVLGGASLTTEKTYLLGKFARVCLKTPYIDYNGRLCMVSAGAGEQEGVRHRSHDQSVGRHDRLRRDLGGRLERRRVLADHHQLSVAGARARRADHHPGSAPDADRAHLRSVPAGQARPRRGAVCRRAADHDRARLDRSRVHRRADGRLRRGRGVLPRVDDREDRRRHRRAARSIDAGRGNVGDAAHRLPAACARHRASLQRRAERARLDQPRARHRTASAGRTAATARSSARPTARADASTARSAISCPDGATSPIPNTAATSPASGASTKPSCPGPGVDAYEMFRKIDTGEIKGLISICFNPKVSLPDNTFRDALSRQARVLRRDRFLPERHRAPRRHRAAGQPARRGRRHGHAGRRSNHQGQQGGGLSGRGAAGLAHHPGHRRARSTGRTDSRSQSRARSSKSCASPARAASPITPA